MSRVACSSSARPTCFAAVSGSSSSSAVSARAWASAARASGWPVWAAIRASASAQRAGLRPGAVAGEEARRPAQTPDRVVDVLAALPALEHEPAVLGRRVAVAGLVLEVGQRGGRVELHGDDVQPRGGVQRAQQQRPGARGLAAEGMDGAEGAVGDQGVVGADVAGLKLAAQLDGGVPVAELAQDVGDARQADVLERVGAARAAQAERGGERLVRAAVVARGLQGRAEALVELGGLRRELVGEREREPGADRLDAGGELAALGRRHALQSQGAGAQVDALGALGLLAGRAREGRPPRRACPRSAGSRPTTSRSAAASPGRPLVANESAATRRAASARSRSPRSS